MLYQGEFLMGQKSGKGRLECYINNMSLSSLIPQVSEVDFKGYRGYIKDKIVNDVKKDIEAEITKTIKAVSKEYSGMDDSLITEKIKEFEVDKDAIDDLVKEKARSTLDKQYIGEFSHDFKQGFGVMKYSNSDFYEGQFKGDKRHGFGKYTYLSPTHGCLCYFGKFNEDSLHGYGKLFCHNGDILLGEFRSNKMHDENGLIKYANSDVYEGGVAMNMKHAKNAKYTYSNGDTYIDDIIYDGDFDNDIKKGHGKVHVKSVNLSITGDFDETELISCDNAEMKIDDIEYKGSMRNTSLYGKGTIKHLDTGNEYTGEFKDNHKHGPCEFILREGDKEAKFTGEYRYGVEISSKSDYGKRK